MTNYSKGHQAELVAAEYLSSKGFKIIGMNWKNPLAEIDIIAEIEGVIFFVEVKYRTTTLQGHGIDYVTDKKIKQMSFAAEMWVSNNNWGGEYQLSAIELSGKDFEVTNFVQDL